MKAEPPACQQPRQRATRIREEEDGWGGWYGGKAPGAGG